MTNFNFCHQNKNSWLRFSQTSLNNFHFPLRVEVERDLLLAVTFLRWLHQPQLGQTATRSLELHEWQRPQYSKYDLLLPKVYVSRSVIRSWVPELESDTLTCTGNFPNRKLNTITDTYFSTNFLKHSHILCHWTDPHYALLAWFMIQHSCFPCISGSLEFRGLFLKTLSKRGGDRESSHLLVDFPNACRNLILVSHSSGKDQPLLYHHSLPVNRKQESSKVELGIELTLLWNTSILTCISTTRPIVHPLKVLHLLFELWPGL